jgi:hypothetical protein
MQREGKIDAEMMGRVRQGMIANIVEWLPLPSLAKPTEQFLPEINQSVLES